MHALSECVSERHHSRIVEPFLDIYSTRSSSLLPPPFYSPTSLPIELSFIFVKVKTLDDYQLAWDDCRSLMEMKRSKCWNDDGDESPTDAQSRMGGLDSFRPATIPGIRQTKQIWEMASNLSSVCGGVGDRESLRSVLIEYRTIYLLFTTQTTSTVLAAPANRFDEIGSFFSRWLKKKSTLGSSSFVNDVTQRSMAYKRKT